MFIKEYLPFYKRNLKIAIPVMLSQMGQVMVQQIDNMMVGHFGTTELAAASFANSIFIVGMVLGMGFAFGLTPLIGNEYIIGNHKKVATLFKNSVALNFLITITLGGTLYLLSFLMSRMGQPEAVTALAIPYYKILLLSFIPFMLFLSIKQFAEGIANTSVAMYVTLIANVVNIILNYIFIFGNFGCPAMGLNGAGYATLISRVIMPIFIIYFLSRDQWIKKYFIMLSKVRFQLNEIKKLLQIGTPIALQMLLEVLAFAISAIMMGWIGEIPLAAHQIALGLASISFMIVTGIGSGTTIRISHQYGKKNLHGLHYAAFASIHLVLAFMTLTALAFVIFRHSLAALYTNSPEVLALASQLLIYAAIFQIFDGLQVVSLSILRGMMDVKYAMYYSFISFIVINIPVGYLLAFVFNMGPSGIWLGFVVGLLFASILFFIRFRQIYNSVSKNKQWANIT